MQHFVGKIATVKPASRQDERRRVSDARMLRAAMHIVAEKGAASATLAEIGLAAGYSRGLPAERFGTKLALLNALMDFMEHWFERRVREAVADKTGMAAVRARIDAHIDGACADRIGTAALYSCFVASLYAMPGLRLRIQALSESFHRGFRTHLAEARKKGELRKGTDTAKAASILVGALRGMIIQSLLDDGVTDLAACRSQIHAVFEAGLAAARKDARERMPVRRRA